ncbi:phosphomannomutase-like isoform X3 [Carya illinoinensis]|uniref:phosphomannomutase-like isoform X3 n=1 Tax=Carya illinoinensis TaxID=32201 RepID=UPI001C71811C|nr:phosphomannomutase-like isoform X3 [Carya illinoinensis]
MAVRKPGLIALFDVDGTLTAPRKAVTPKMLEFMGELRKVVTVGVVGGSDLSKISEQLGKTVIDDYDYVFSENGLVAHKDGKLVGTQKGAWLFAELTSSSFLLICPDEPSRAGSTMRLDLRVQNLAVDSGLSLKSMLGEDKLKEFINFTLHYIADLDIRYPYKKVFPQGWDKTYCLRYLDDFHEIHFFGDKTYSQPLGRK